MLKNIAPLCHTYTYTLPLSLFLFLPNSFTPILCVCCCGADNMAMTGHCLGQLSDLCPTKEHRHKNLYRHCHTFLSAIVHLCLKMLQVQLANSLCALFELLTLLDSSRRINNQLKSRL